MQSLFTPGIICILSDFFLSILPKELVCSLWIRVAFPGGSFKWMELQLRKRGANKINCYNGSSRRKTLATVNHEVNGLTGYFQVRTEKQGLAT